MKKVFLYLCLSVFSLCRFPVVAQQVQYQITEAELQQLEILYQNSLADKQKAEYALKELQPLLSRQEKIMQTLRSESIQLSKDLQNERQTVSNLTQSVSALETEMAAEQNKAAQIQQNLNDERLAHQKTKNQRNVLFFILIVIVLAAAGAVVAKIATRFYKPF